MNLKIRGKLFLSFGLIIFITIALGLYSYISINTLNHNSQQMNNIWISGLDIAHDMNTSFSDYRGKEYRHILLDNYSQMNAVENEMRELENLVTKLLDEYINTAVLEEDKKLIYKVHLEWESYLKINDRVLSLSIDNKNKEAEQLMITEGLAQYNRLTAATTNLVKYNKDNCASNYDHNMKTAKFSQLVLVTVIITILIISFITVIIISREIATRINLVTNILVKTSKFDLEFDAEAYKQIKKFKGNDEIRIMADALISMRKELRNIVSSIKEDANKIYSNSHSLFSTISETSDSIEEVAKATDGVAEGSTELARDVQDGAEKLEQLANEINEVTKSSDLIKHHADYTVAVNNKGMEYVEKLKLAVAANEEVTSKVGIQVDKLANNSKDVSKITDAIKSIADQINLLSLNAAIEAARAGEQGRGFAVVAEEIRKLASETATSTEQIDDIINKMKQAVNKTKEQMTEAATAINDTSNVTKEAENSFKEIGEAIFKIIVQIKGLVESIYNMNSAKDTVVATISNISAIAQESASTTEEISASIQEQSSGIEQISYSTKDLDKISTELENLVKKFKI